VITILIITVLTIGLPRKLKNNPNFIPFEACLKVWNFLTLNSGFAVAFTLSVESGSDFGIDSGSVY